MTIFKTEKDKKEFVAAFKKLTMSGAVSEDAAINKILRDYPHYFNQPTPDDIVKTSRAELNSEIRQRARAGLQSDKLADRIFANIQPTDKPR
jgi:phosphoenolpyruvate synthase/pyruvate phosphate dikinase